MASTHSSSSVERPYASRVSSEYLDSSYYLHCGGYQRHKSDMPINLQDSDISELGFEGGARFRGCEAPFRGSKGGTARTTRDPGDERPVVPRHHNCERTSMGGHTPDDYDINENNSNTVHSHSDYIPETTKSGEHNLLVSRPSNNLEASSGAPIQLPGPRLPQNSQKRHFIAIFDVFLVLVAASFVVFAFLVQSNDGEPGDPNSLGRALLLAASYGPTVFPVIFAGIVGRTMKLVATWKLQKGATFGRVEQLLASNTVFNAVTAQVQLRAFDLAGLFIVFLWMLSPIGSQAALRVVYSASTPQETTEFITVLDPQSSYYMGEALSSNLYNNMGRPMFASAMLHASSPQGRGTQDIWANLRIPMIEALDSSASQDWISINDSSNILYSSLVGIPTSSRNLPGESEFTLRLSYVALDCPIFTISNGTQGGFTNFSDPASSPSLSSSDDLWWAGPIGVGKNYGGPGSIAPWKLAQIATPGCGGSCHCHISNCTEAHWPARRLIWESRSFSGVTHADCNMHTTYVEVNYSCSGSHCGAIGVRRSPQPLGGTNNKTAFDNDGHEAGGSIYSFLDQFIALYELPGTRYMSPLVAYLMSPSESPTWLGNNDSTSVIDAGRQQFEIRLAQLINTLCIIGISPPTISGYLSVDERQSQPGVTDIPPDRIITVPVRVITSQSIVRCDKGWFAALLLASLAIMVMAVIGVIVRSQTLVPDILGTLSLATLDNQCGDIAKGGSTLDGMERTRLLRHVKIRLGDINPTGVYGRIALSGQLQGPSVATLERSRLYE